MPGTHYIARGRPIISSIRPFSSIRVSDISSPPYPSFLTTLFVSRSSCTSSIFFLFLFSHCLGFSASYFALLRIILDRRRRRRDTPEWTGSIFGSRARDVGRMHLHLHLARKKRSVPILTNLLDAFPFTLYVKSEINLDFIDIYIWKEKNQRDEKCNYILRFYLSSFWYVILNVSIFNILVTRPPWNF